MSGTIILKEHDGSSGIPYRLKKMKARSGKMCEMRPHGLSMNRT